MDFLKNPSEISLLIMEEKSLQTIKESIKELIEKAGFSCEIEIKESARDEGQEEVICNIQTKEDSNLLIGQYGVNLQSFQHIARMIVRKRISDKLNFILDINSYREQKNQSIIEQAKEAAQQAINEGRVIIMKPMSAYERRLVHMELSKNEKIMTESVGEGENRKVLVKPTNEIS